MTLLGPVFAYEWTAAARRRSTYALRAAFLLVLLLMMATAFVQQRYVDPDESPLRQHARVGGELFCGLVVTQLVLVLLAAPAMTCGSVCLDAARGNLLLVLATDIGPAEIVAGKLAGRVAGLLTLVLGSVPLVFLTTLVGGIEPEAVVPAYAVLFAVGVAGCCVAFMFSVWVRRPHEALLLTYLVLYVLVMVQPVAWLGGLVGLWPRVEWPNRVSPFTVVQGGYSDTPFDADDVFILLGVCLAVAAAATVLATLTLRRATRPGREAVARRRRFRWPPALDRNPMRWYEWHRQRPSAAMRWFGRAYALLLVAAVAGPLAMLTASTVYGVGLAVMAAAIAAGCGYLVVAVRAVTVLADERTRGALDVLLATPLTVREVLAAKWRRAFAAARPVGLCVGGLAAAGYAHTWFASGWAAYDSSWEAIAALMLVPLMLAYAAFFASAGLLLAARCRSLGWAMGVQLLLYVAVSVGWVMVMGVFGFDDQVATVPAPWIGCAVLVGAAFSLSGNSFAGPLTTAWAAGTTLGYAVAAAVLYAITLRRFDRWADRPRGRALASRVPVVRV